MDGLVRARGLLGAEVRGDAPLLAAIALEDLYALEPGAALVAQQVGALACDALRVAQDARDLAAVLVVPGAALPGLHAVLVAHPHDLPAVLELDEQVGQTFSQIGAARTEIRDEQVGQCVWTRCDAEVCAWVAGQLADQEDEPADARFEQVVVGARFELLDELVDLAREDPGLQEVGGDLFEDEVARHDAAEVRVRRRAGRLVDDLELVAELPRRAALVHRPQEPLPEATPYRQEGVVRHEDVAVLGAMRDLGADEVPGDLPDVVGEHVIDAADLVGLLGQDDLADDGLDVGVGQLDLHGEAPHQLLEHGGARQRGLARADEEQAPAELLAAGLGDLLDEVVARLVLADVLLDLVEADQRERELAVDGEGVADGVDHLLGRDVGGLGELLAQERAGLLRAGGEAGVDIQERGSDVRRHVEVAQLPAPVLASGLDVALDRVDVALVAQPHHEAGEGVLLGQAHRIEDEVEQLQASVVPRSRAELPRRRVQAAEPAARRGQLLE